MEAEDLIELVRQRIADKRDTQVGFSKLLGIHSTAVSKLLSGKRRLASKEADVLREFFGLRIEDEQGRPHLLPIVGLVAAGAWREGFENIMGYMPSPDSSLSEDSFVVILEGDSMDLVAENGEAVIVDPNDRRLVNNAYYVIRNPAGETTFKQYRESPARLEPCSNNDKHVTIYPGEDGFEVVGRCRKKVSDL